MSQLKNEESFGTFFKWVKNTGLVFSTSLVMMTSLIGSASAFSACDPCGSMDCCEMPDFVVYADFIYWQRHIEGECLAYTAPSTEIAQGKWYTGECDFNPGFRVGAVVDLGCCEWDFFAQYTWLNPNHRFHTPDGEVVTVNGIDVYTGAYLDHDDHFNVLDFGMGRTFNVNECFVFRPHFGFKATWQELNRKKGLILGSTATSEENFFRDQIDFNGIGLRAGFDSAWRFSPCFSLVGNLALSSIYSDLDVNHYNASIITVDGVQQPDIPISDLKANHCVLLPVLELLLGVRWDSRVCDCYDVFVFVGWENQVWFNLNQYIPADLECCCSGGNMTYQGLTVRAGFGF